MRKNLLGLVASSFVVSVVLLGISGCTEDYFELDKLQTDIITWEPDLAIPLVNSTVTVEDVIGEADSTNEYVYGADGFITLIYRERIFSQTINDIFQLPSSIPMADTKQLTSGEASTLNANGDILFSGLNHDFGIIAPTGSALDKLTFHQGQLQISVSGNFQTGATLKVSYPEMKNSNGQIMTQTVNLTSSGGQLTGNTNVDLAGYTMDLNANGPNSVPVNYQLSLTGGGTVSSSDQLTITSNFSNSRIAYTDGYFGQFDLNVNPNTVSIKIFESSENDDVLYFEDPKLRIKIKNSFGVPFQSTVNSLTAIDGALGNVPINYDQIWSGGVVNVPSITQAGDVDSITYVFKSGNSNIKDVINGNYDKIEYDMDASTNPFGPVPGVQNFASLNSALEVTAEIELPFFGSANHYRIQDTIDSPIGEAEDFKDNIEEALLRISTVNGLPMDGILKLYLTDDNYVITDSLLANGEYLIESGVIDGNGKVTTPNTTNNDIEMDSTRVEKLFGAKYIIFSADLTSTNNAGKNIKVYAEDNLAVRIGIRIKLNASPNDLDNL